MTEYPEDIMKAARGAIDRMPDLKAMMDPSEFWEAAENQVCAALLAERQRCAGVAESFGGAMGQELHDAIMKGGEA